MFKTLASSFILLAGATFAADSALLKLLPPDATTVAGIDVEKSKNSPFGRFLLAQVADDEKGLRDLQETTGFDPRRDLREIVAAGGADKKAGLFIASGTFDQSRIINAARAEGATILVYEGLNVIGPKAKQSDSWIAFLDSSTVIGGREDRVRAAIAQRKTAATLPYLAQALDLGSRFDAWVISTEPTAGFLRSLPNNKNGEMLRSVQHASAGVKFGMNVQIDAKAIARSEKDATALHDVIRFIAGMVQLNRDNPKADQVATLLDSMKLQATGDTVTLSLSVPEAELEKLIESGRSRHRASARID